MRVLRYPGTNRKLGKKEGEMTRVFRGFALGKIPVSYFKKEGYSENETHIERKGHGNLIISLSGFYVEIEDQTHKNKVQQEDSDESYYVVFRDIHKGGENADAIIKTNPQNLCYYLMRSDLFRISFASV
jgi:hypothetical protein